MERVSASTSLKEIGTLFGAGVVGPLSDRQLLERFLDGQGGSESEAAFAMLVRRHGSMVHGVCLSVLRDRDAADDAFQAAFLVLARRAGAIRQREALASWLYGVACRVATRARSEASRRRALESRAAMVRHQTRASTAASVEPIPELFEEIDRLPQRYRAPIVLCYLEGQSHEQAARTLKCPVRTLQTRLLRARARLRSRLLRRGLAPAATLIAADRLASQASASIRAALPETLIDSTAQAAIRFAATRGIKAAVALGTAAALAKGVIQATLHTSLIRFCVVATTCVTGAAVMLSGLGATDEKPKEPVQAIIGRVLDQEGKPIAGAELWLPVTTSDDDRDTAHAKTGASGNYTLKVPESWATTPPHQREWIVWAFASGHHISSANAGEPLNGKPRSVDVTLGPLTDTAFLVLGPDGRPLAGARVEPLHFKTHMSYNFPPRGMLPLIRAVTDASGRAQLPAMPREGFLTVKISTEALGIQHQRLTDKASEPALRTIRLRPTARVEGRLVTDTPDAARGVPIYLETTDPGNWVGGQEGSSGFAKVETGDDGSFSVPALATGTLRIQMQIKESLPLRERLPESLDVRAGAVTRLEIPLVPAVRVHGQIRVKGSGKPVVGAAVHLYYGGWRQGATPVSDREGKFEAYVLPGDVRMQVIDMPDDHVQLGEPTNDRYKVPADAQEFQLPSIEVVPGTTIKGRLIKGKNEPVANVRLAGKSGGHLYGYGSTDARGAFTLSGVPAGFPLTYEALDDTSGWVETTILKKDPLLLRIGPAQDPMASGVAVSGTVLDAQGKPVADARVMITVETGRRPGDQPGSTLVTQKSSTINTDAQGRYLMKLPVEQGYRFRALATPENYTLAGTDWITADGKNPITFPPITVTALRTIAGRVLDSKGRPAAGASVLNWGNRAPLTSAVTDADGSFRLDGVPPGESRLFVEAAGFRFHGQVIGGADASVELKIRRDHEPPEQTITPRWPVLSRAEAAALARQVITPYSEKILRPGASPDARSRVLEVLAQIDPDEAWRKCQAGEAPWNHNAVRIAVVHRFLESDPDDAAAIIPTITSEFWRNYTRFEVTDSLPADRNELKAALVNEAILDAKRTGDSGTKASLLARAAQRLIEMGKNDEARKLVDLALPLAKTADASDSRLGATRQLLLPLARLDLNAALSLIPTQGDDRTINDFRGLIAQSSATGNPAEAERLLGQMDWNRSETYIVKACARMTAVDLPRARRLAGTIKSDVLRGYAQGKMAETVNQSNKAAALELLTEAFQSINQVMGRGFGSGGVWGTSAAAPMAAALLPVVERVAPDRLGEFIQRVLSLQWYPRTLNDLRTTTPDTSGLESLRSRAALAALLVRYDRDLARSISGPIIDRFRKPFTEVENRYLDRYAIFTTLTLADPRAITRLVEESPDLKEQDLGPSLDIARLIIAGTLSASDSQFWTIIKRAVTDLELVERED